MGGVTVKGKYVENRKWRCGDTEDLLLIANNARFCNLFSSLQVTSKPLGVFMSDIKCFINLI